MLVSLMLGAQASRPSRIPAPPATDIALSLDAVQDGRVVTYTIHFDNMGATNATVDLWDRLPAASTYLGDPADVVDGVWNETFENLPPGPHSVVLSVRMAEVVGDGDLVRNLVTMQYVSQGRLVVKTYEHAFPMRFPPAPSAGLPFAVLAAPPLAIGGGIAGFAAYRRMRRPKIEQVFLMHRSGMLIHHWSVTPSPARDIDILSAMFVILKEFVRDILREKEGGLSELKFGDSHMLLAEGRHSVLATVVSGGRLNGLPGQIREAVRDFEARNGGSLPEWTGQLEVLDGAGDIVDDLVGGRYVHHMRRST